MTIELEILIIAAAAIGLVCGVVGYWWANTNQRRAAGGKTVQELSAEKARYETDVEEHFKATADLLNEMTDKYRDVYRHMAEGAQKLAPGENVAPALAALKSGLLAAPGEATREAIIQPESEPGLGNNDGELSEEPSLDATGDEIVDIEPANVEQVANADDESVSEPPLGDVPAQAVDHVGSETSVDNGDEPLEAELDNDQTSAEKNDFFSDDPKRSSAPQTDH